MKYNMIKFRDKLLHQHEVNREVAKALNKDGNIHRDDVIQYAVSLAVAKTLYQVIVALDDSEIHE